MQTVEKRRFLPFISPSSLIEHKNERRGRTIVSQLVLFKVTRPRFCVIAAVRRRSKKKKSKRRPPTSLVSSRKPPRARLVVLASECGLLTFRYIFYYLVHPSSRAPPKRSKTRSPSCVVSNGLDIVSLLARQRSQVCDVYVRAVKTVASLFQKLKKRCWYVDVVVCGCRSDCPHCRPKRSGKIGMMVELPII